ncbi:MAG TPA: hypothetical protein VFO85_12915, partial [Vicinamibacteria bacterium]|nr:hypothetical protein [Vicinamibacteria bacterium]
MSDMDALLVGRWTGETDQAERAAAPDPSEVAYMAYNGHSGRVFGVLKLLPAARRADYELPAVLRQAVVGGLEALRATSPADPGRPGLISLVGELVERHVQRAGRAASRDLVRSLLEWSRFLFAEARLPEAELAADRALDLSLTFPDLRGRVVLEKAACLSARGDHAAAYALLDALFSRCDLVADRGVVPEVALALGRA